MAYDLFSEEDLAALFEEVNEANSEVEEELTPEMEASQRRYMEIIKKHKS